MKIMLTTGIFCLVMSHAGEALAQETIMSLVQLYEQANRQSQQLQINRTGVESSRESVKTAKNNMLPDVNMSLSGSYIGNAMLLSRGFSSSGYTTVPYAVGVGQTENGKKDTPHWGNSFALQVSEVLYAGGAIRAGIRMAELGEQLASLDVTRNEQDIRFLLTGYYLDLYKLQNQLRVIDKNISLTEEVIKNMKARRKEGTVLKNDITRYELQLQSLELSKTQIENASSIINHQLVTTLHLPSSVVIRTDTVELNSEYNTLVDIANEEEWQRRASDNNVGLKQAALQTDIAKQQLKLSKAEMRPSIAFVAEEHLDGPYTKDLIPVNANVNVWFVGVGVKYNLGSIWRKNHNVRKAYLNERQSREKLILAQEGINKAVQANYTNFLTSHTEVETQEKQVELADQNYSVVKNRYENDLALLTDMLDASNMKVSAEMALVNARVSLLYNYYNLKYITNSL